MDGAFENAVTRFRESLTKSQREQFASCNKQDVERTIQDIQLRHGSQNRLKYMRRVSKFIEGMSQLGQVVDGFLNVDNTIAFIWGPIKFLLLAANTWVETLDLLLETYAEIGEALPGLSQYQRLFGKYPFVQKHLENYYCDVLEFNRIALEVFARPGWKTVFHLSWKTFKSRFGPILSNFKRHKHLLMDEKMTALMSEVQDLRRNAEEKFQLLESEINARHARELEKDLAEIEESRCRQRRIVQRKLDAPDFYKDHEYASHMRHKNCSGEWILVDPRFQEWAELGTFSSKWFYLNGIPGAGKTILVSSIIDHLKDLRAKSEPLGHHFSVIYFYFKHLHENKRRMTHLLLSILDQLAEQDSSLLEYLYRELSSIDQQKLSLQKLCDLASTALRTQRRCFIIVDGLDECAQDPIDSKFDEVGRIIKWFEELMRQQEETVSDTNSPCIRLLISGQRDGYLEEELGSYPSLQLETIAGHGEDIKSYAKIGAAKICKQFSAGREAEEDIIQKVTMKAKGMFLFAKIVLDNLLDQISAFDFESELKAENFPEGLDKAYERVVKRVLKNPKKPERLAAEQILGWVASAERPLRWREIQSRFCIDPETGRADIQRQSVKSCKYLCGSLIEVGMTGDLGDLGDPGFESEVEMVHSSAKTYLIQTEALCLSTEHAKMALFCTQYLTSRPFRLSTEKDIQAYAHMGYYGFHDYATAFWWNHVDKLIEAREAVGSDTYRRTLQSVAILLRIHLKLVNAKEDKFDDLNTVTRRFRELPKNPRERERVMSLDFSTEIVRNAIEAIQDGVDSTFRVDETNNLPLYGSFRYKCPKPWCQLFSTGFMKSEQRKDHVNEHERPFHCSTEGCYLVDVGFPTEYALSQHVKRHHLQPEIVLFPKQKQSSKRRRDIYIAAKEGDLNSIKDFAAAGGNIDRMKRTLEGKRTPLMLAVEYGHLGVCEYLLDKGASANFRDISSGENILHTAVRRDDLDIIDLLLKQDTIAVDVTVESLTAPCLAAAIGSNRSLSLFRERKPHSFDMKSCLGQAVKHDQIRTVQMLLKADGVNIDILQSLIIILPTSSDDMIRLLISSGMPKDNNQIVPGNILLCEACRLGDIHLTRRLISLVDNPNSPDHMGLTPLEIAAGKGFADIVSTFLMSCLVDLRRLYQDKNSVLKNYSSGIIKLILEADPSLAIQTDKDSSTLLHHAAYEGNEELVRLLIQMDVNVNAVLQDYPYPWQFVLDTDPALLTPLRIALKLSSKCLDIARNSLLSISQALVASENIRLSNLECREELEHLVLAVKLENQGLVWSLIEKGLLSHQEGPCSREYCVSQLMIEIKRDMLSLITLATGKKFLEDVLTTLVAGRASYKTENQGWFLTLVRSNISFAKKILTHTSLIADETRLEENRLAIEEAIQQNDDEMVKIMIHRGFDASSTALLLAAEIGTIEMVEAIVQTGIVDFNTQDGEGRRPADIALENKNFAVYERLRMADQRSVFMGAEASGEDF